MRSVKFASKRNRKGSVLVLISVMATTLIALAGLAIDIGLAYRQHAHMQMTCDAAALAGVVQLPPSQTGGNDLMLSEARRFTALNGITHLVNGYQVTGQIPAGSPNDYRVTITGQYNTLFVSLVGMRSFNLAVQATARSFSQLPINIVGSGNPGQSNGLTTLSLFGPYAFHSYGDAYSTRFLNSGVANPAYNPNGYDFQIVVPANYRTLFNTNMLKVQIYDPDCGSNPGGATDGTDELRDPNNVLTLPPGFQRETTSQYSLFTVPNGFKDLTTQTQIATQTYGVNASTSNQWVTPSGFSINLDDYPGVTTFRLNVKSIGGSSENGFNIRAGPPALEQSTDWSTGQAEFNTATERNALNMIKASGYLPLNFGNGSGTATFNLGTLPAANGVPYKVIIKKFDTDVGAQSIAYQDGLGSNFPSQLVTTNGAFDEDVLQIPANYPGSTLAVLYTAGGADTSSWSMAYEGSAPGLPGTVKLIQ